MAPFGSRGSSGQQHPSDALRHFEAAQVFEIIRKSALSTAIFWPAKKFCTTFATWGRGFDNPPRSQPQASRYLWVGTRESADNPLCSTEPHIFFGLRRNSFDTQSPSPLIQSRFEGRSMSRCSFVEGSARHAAGRPAAWQGGNPFCPQVSAPPRR